MKKQTLDKLNKRRMNVDEAIMLLDKKGWVVLTSEGFMPDELYRSEVWIPSSAMKYKKCIFKGNNADELIKFAEDVQGIEWNDK